MFRTPRFWNKRIWINSFLIPFSWMWVYFSKLSQSRIKTEHVDVPVICIGNLVMGGAGKTPTVIALTAILKSIGHNPHILSRGYGAYIRNSIQVDPKTHNYLQVGDEPLLLAKVAPTWVGPDRVMSARAAIKAGASILIMDDGLQNPSLFKDLSIVVIDAIQGVGNGLVFPAGPLREPIEIGANRADAMIVIGGGNIHFDFIDRQFSARIVCENDTSKNDYSGNKNESDVTPGEVNHSKVSQHKSKRRVVAFAGIGYPEKFKITLLENNFEICDFITFADHHPYTIGDIIKLMKVATQHRATLITTSKDCLRIPERYQHSVTTLPIVLEFDQPQEITTFLERTVIPTQRV